MLHIICYCQLAYDWRNRFINQILRDNYFISGRIYSIGRSRRREIGSLSRGIISSSQLTIEIFTVNKARVTPHLSQSHPVK